MARRAAVGWLLVAATSTSLVGTERFGPPAQAGLPGPVTVRAIVVDRSGSPITDLGPGDFTVSIDGTNRKVIDARFLPSGAGTEARTVLVVVDETRLPQGNEKIAAGALGRLIDRLTATDRVAVVTLPLPRAPIAFTVDRAPVREALSHLVGRSRPAEALDQPSGPPPATDAVSGARERPSETARQTSPQGRDPNAPPEENPEYVFDALARLLNGLRQVPGFKVAVLATAGLSRPEGGSRRPDAADTLRTLARAVETEAIGDGVVVHVLGLPGTAASASAWTEFEQLSGGTGGMLVRPSRDPHAAADRLGLALGGSYRITITGDVAEFDGGLRPLKIGTVRADAQVLAASRWAARAEPAPGSPDVRAPATPPAPHSVPEVPAAGRPAPPPPTPTAVSPSASAGPAPTLTDDKELEPVLRRALEYLQGYRREFANVVAEEDYVQTASESLASGQRVEMRRLKADFLMVTAPDGTPWIPFRDVFEVDGRAVRDRDDRLRRLFLETPATAMDQALRIREEGGRYNVGPIPRTVNVPIQPLLLLAPDRIGGLRFRRRAPDTVDGLPTWRVDFEEVGRPTLIRGSGGVDVPSSGTLWIDPVTGAIVKTFLRARHPGPIADDIAGLVMDTTVIYHRSATLGVWIPAEMRESYREAHSRIDGVAKYSNVRTFQVTTHEDIKREDHDGSMVA